MIITNAQYIESGAVARVEIDGQPVFVPVGSDSAAGRALAEWVAAGNQIADATPDESGDI
ncbi:MAG: hypothetical protein C0606_00550 [Hyphomicrobiales bacterium]|nr:MAG: hypothetical protein C0606_00550 [Hyphomicrobiales bacterium]